MEETTGAIERAYREGYERTIGIAVGSCFVFFAALGLTTRLRTFGLDRWELELFSLPAWLPGTITFFCYFAHRIAAGRLWARIAVWGYPLAQVLWLTVPAPVDRLMFWIHTFPGVAGIIAVVAYGARRGWVAYVVCCLTTEVILWRLGHNTDPLIAAGRAFFSLIYSGYFVGVAVLVLHAMGLAADSVRRSAEIQAEARALRAREAEIARLQRMTHDQVMGLLAHASALGGGPTLALSAQATLRQLGEGFAAGHDLEPLSEVSRRIVERSRISCPDVVVEIVGDPEGSMPGPVGAEIEAAAHEALHNSIRHAGPCTRRLTLRHRPDSIEVIVADDGLGFDLERSVGRLGVRESILGRLRGLPGGSASVQTSPGWGTTVDIGWRRP